MDRKTRQFMGGLAAFRQMLCRHVCPVCQAEHGSTVKEAQTGWRRGLGRADRVNNIASFVSVVDAANLEQIFLLL